LTNPGRSSGVAVKAYGKGGSIAYTLEGRSIVAGIKEGSRNSTLTSLAGTMRARGMTEEGIYTALLAENNARSNPPLDEAEVKKYIV